jgi:hypothetical protein
MWQRFRTYLIAPALLAFWAGLWAATIRADAQTAQTTSTGITPVASVLQIMNVLTNPASEIVFSAVLTVSSSRGVENISPKTDREWQTVEDNAALLVESGNLLLIGTRVRDKGDWTRLTRQFVEASIVSMKAAKARNVNALYASYDELYLTCERCHLKYFK